MTPEVAKREMRHGRSRGAEIPDIGRSVICSRRWGEAKSAAPR